MKAIREDKAGQWMHISDLNGFDSDVSKLYGIKSIPRNYLLDPDGKIVAMNLRGEALEKKLSEIL